MIEVVCAMIERDGRLLVAQRGPAQSLAGKWELPGGKIEPHESPKAALAREIEEELGCVVRVLGEFGASVYAYSDRTIVLRPFHCELVEGIPRALEHVRILWASRDILETLDWAEADVPIIEAYLGTAQGADVGP